MAVNDDLKDRAIDHAAMARKVEMGVQQKLTRVNNRHDTKVFRMISRGDIRGVAGEIRRASREAFVEVRDSLVNIGRADVDFHTGSLNKATRGIYKVKSPSQRGITKLVTESPIRDNRTLVQHFGDIGAGENTRTMARIKNMQSKDMTNKQIAMDVKKNGTKVTRAQQAALTRTAMTMVTSGTSMMVMDENKEIMKGFQFAATLDRRTTPICAHHDGNVYKKSEGNTPPLHWRCRSIVTPVLEAYDKIADSAGATTKKLKGKRAAFFDGGTPVQRTYSEWLRRQPLETIIRHTGDAERANLFTQGKLLLSQFTTKAGDIMGVTALRRLDNRATSYLPTSHRNASEAKFGRYKVDAVRPDDIIRNRAVRNQLVQLYRADANDIKSTLSITDYRGILRETKVTNRRRLNNRLVEDNSTYRDPFTGETRSTLIYQPDHDILDERIALVRNSNDLTPEQKNFIETFSVEMEGHVSTNQQSVIVENLRIIFERHNRTGQDWINSQAVIRGEIKNSVLNVSRRLETNSRSKNNVFKGVLGEEIEDSLLGTTNLKELNANLISNRLKASAWEQVVARAYATDLYLRGRFPLGIYFDNFSAAVQRRVLDAVIPSSFRTGQRYLKNIRKIASDPSLNFQDFLRRNSPRQLRLDFEDYVKDTFRAQIKKYLPQLSPAYFIASKIPVPTLGLKSIASAVRTVAAGRVKDYDQLAITIGKQLRGDFTEPDFFGPNVATYRKDGTRILDSMVDRGMIRVNTVETRKRRLQNLDRGIEYGPWVETTSRQIEIVDKGLLAYARLNRRIEIAERVGVTSSSQKLRVRRRSNVYTSGGPLNIDTSRSVITRSASGSFDPDIIDKDVANMLNHAMDVEWSVDNNFSDFMLNMVRYRDRNNIEKYDDLNGFRKTILERGQEGFGFVKTLDFHRQRNKSFSLIAQIDGRGRVYYRGYLTPTGGEVIRPFLNTARAKAMGPEGVRELFEQSGALLGGNNALTTTARIATATDHLDELVNLGRLITENRPSSIRQVLSHRLVQQVGGEETPKLLRLALEHYRLDNHLSKNYSQSNVDRLSRTFMTQLAVEVDASSSGAQIISLSTRNRQLADRSNVTPTMSKNRLYDITAERAYSDPRIQRLIENGLDIDLDDLKKAAKAQNMVTFYGAGAKTQSMQVERELAKRLGMRDNFVIINSADLEDFNANLIRVRNNARRDGDDLFANRVENVRRDINDSIRKEERFSNALVRDVKEIHPDSKEFVDKFMNNQRKVVTPEHFRQISMVMSELLADEAPILQHFTQFWGRAAETFLRKTGKQDIPWRTFDGKTFKQSYPVTVEEIVQYTDPRTGRQISNIVSITKQPNKSGVIDRTSFQAARSGYGVNGNHMNDASIVRQYHLWGRRNRVDTSTIHDAFFQNIGDTGRVKRALLRIYADSVSSNQILNTLKAMRAAGLPFLDYLRLRREAIRLGLLNPSNPLTRRDILRPHRPGEGWYGVGP